jgi:hypothetical protein
MRVYALEPADRFLGLWVAMKSWLSPFLAIMVAGCATATPDPAAQMCSAATLLADARLVAAKAVVADQSGQRGTAQDLAQQARTTAEQGDADLQAVTADARRGATWQALTMAHQHLGQAAAALLGTFANTDGTSSSELAAVDVQFAIAQKALPGSCFAAGVNQPGSRGA